MLFSFTSPSVSIVGPFYIPGKTAGYSDLLNHSINKKINDLYIDIKRIEFNPVSLIFTYNIILTELKNLMISPNYESFLMDSFVEINSQRLQIEKYNLCKVEKE